MNEAPVISPATATIDLKKGKKQINYGLLADRDGRPVSVRAYSGNTTDPNTVTDQLRRVRQTFGI